MNRRQLFTGSDQLPPASNSTSASLAKRKHDAETYCRTRSGTLRRYEAESRWLIGRAVELVPESPPAGADREKYRKQLTAQLRKEVQEKYRFSILLYILLYVVIPIAVRFFLEWWFRKGQQGP